MIPVLHKGEGEYAEKVHKFGKIIWDSRNRGAASLTYIRKRYFLCMEGLCGASDYGPFSANSPSLFSDKDVTARLIFPDNTNLHAEVQ